MEKIQRKIRGKAEASVRPSAHGSRLHGPYKNDAYGNMQRIAEGGQMVGSLFVAHSQHKMEKRILCLPEA